jgi:hypothetical protein
VRAPRLAVAVFIATLGGVPLAAQRRPATESAGDTASLDGRMRAFFEQVREESRPGAAAFFPRRGDWSWVRSTPQRDGSLRAGVWRFHGEEALPAMSAGGPLCGTFGGRYGHYGPVETVFGMQVKMHEEPWRRVRGTRFVPPGEREDSPTFVEWRREDGRWVVSAFGDRPGYEYVPHVLGEPRSMIVRDLVATPSPPLYATETEWFRNNQPISLGRNRYVKYGPPRPIPPAELSRFGLLGRVVIYVERGTSGDPDTLYVPMNASDYQPYMGNAASRPCD